MPSSCGDSRMTSRRCSLPSKTACAQRLQHVAGRGVVVQVLERGDDDLAGDVARGVAAHAVGDGEQPRAGVDGVLVVAADQAAVRARRISQDEAHASTSLALGGRMRPVAVLRECRHACSRTQLQGSLPDADRLAGTDQERTLHALLVEVGAVGRSEVLHVPLAAAVGRAARGGNWRSRR